MEYRGLADLGQKVRAGNISDYFDSLPVYFRVAALPIKHDSEIDWNTLRDETWNTFSVHAIGHKWLGLKRSVNGADKPYEGIYALLIS